MASNKVWATAGATFLIGASSTAFLYEMDIFRPKRLLRKHQAEVHELNTTIQSQQAKIEEMRKRKEELHNVVSRYQQDEQEQLQKQERHRNMYPILKHGLPGELDKTLFHYDQYISKVDLTKKVPQWVANTLTHDSLRRNSDGGEITRERSVFGSDPKDGMAPEFKASNSDYWHSGYDRGHMVPAGDMKTSQKAMDQTFYLNQNIVPQNGRNNRGYWRRFEAFVRNLPREYSRVHVVTGPLYLPADHDNYELQKGENELGEATPIKRQMNYDVIGDNQVHVPTHLFKCVLAERNPHEVKPGESPLVMSAFLLPNQPIASNVELSSFEVPVEELERKAGFHFFQKARRMANSQQMLDLVSLCVHSKTKCRMQPEDPSLDYISDIYDAKTEQEVHRVWNSMLDQKIKPHEWTKKAYEEKLQRLRQIQARKSESH